MPFLIYRRNISAFVAATGKTVLLMINIIYLSFITSPETPFIFLKDLKKNFIQIRAAANATALLTISTQQQPFLSSKDWQSVQGITVGSFS